MKAKVLPQDMTLDHVRLLAYFCEESIRTEDTEAAGYVSWAGAMQWYEREYRKLGFAAASDLIDEKFRDFRLLLPPGNNPRADKFKPPQTVLDALPELLERKAELERKAGIPAAKPTERAKARVEA